MSGISDEERDQMLEELAGAHEPDEVIDLFSFADSTYQGRLDKIRFDYVKEKLKLVMEFEILSGPYRGRSIWKWCNMGIPENLDFLTRDLRKLGITNFKWNDVQEQFPSVLDKCFELQLKTTGDFQNVYITKEISVTVEDGKKPIFTEPTQELADDDIPF